MEESLTKFITESVKRHEENLNIIKEIRASTDVAIRNQGASLKTLEIEIGQMSKVLQERGIGGLPGSTEPNPRDHVKSISTTKVDSSEIRRMECSPYVVSGSQHISIFYETVPFLRRLQNHCCDDWREAQNVKILETYDHTLPQKEKDPGASFIIINDDDVTRDVVLGMPFFMKYVSCQMIMKIFAHGDRVCLPRQSIRHIEPLWIRRMDVSGRY
ncbi:hypothetical protein Tco_0860872 [Tanacetum coccineum]|uniref:Uncharacterized protein n=1 Tax=Tanacetum coccineum TaxID=301880 RepID=A0ABQ5BG79_9ASTR